MKNLRRVIGFICLGFVIIVPLAALGYLQPSGDFVETELPADPPEVPYAGDDSGVLLEGTHSGGDKIRERTLYPEALEDCEICQVCRGDKSHELGDQYCGGCAPCYDRKDWKHWTDADGDGQHARKEVLIIESHEPAFEFTDRGGKKQMKGVWKCPYTGEVFRDARKLDVDHMVPLKEAHLSGGWKWAAEKKEKYANYLEDPDHLVAVTASANRSKGAKDPGEWMPAEDHCGYATAWIRVKEKWELSYDEKESKALMAAVATCAPTYEEKKEEW